MDRLAPFITLAVALVGSQGFWTFVSSYITNKKNKNKELTEDIKEIKTEVNNLSKSLAEHKANIARTNIIRFNDEILNQQKHSKESFDLILLDIDNYEKYCEMNPDYLNNKTALSVNNIKHIYSKHINKEV